MSSILKNYRFNFTLLTKNGVRELNIFDVSKQFLSIQNTNSYVLSSNSGGADALKLQLLQRLQNRETVGIDKLKRKISAYVNIIQCILESLSVTVIESMKITVSIKWEDVATFPMHPIEKMESPKSPGKRLAFNIRLDIFIFQLISP